MPQQTDVRGVARVGSASDAEQVSVGRYALGFGASVCLVGVLGMGAVGLRARLLPGSRGATARLTECVLGLALLVGLSEALGTVGLFRLAPILATSTIVGIGLWSWSQRMRRVVPSGHQRERRPRLADVLPLAWALLVAGLVFTAWAAKTARAYDHGMLGLDTLWLHMPWAAWYAQSGHLATLHFADVQYLSAFYPATGELLHGLGIVLMGNDALSPAFNLLTLGLLLLAAWCIGSPWGLGAATVTGAALSMTVFDMFSSQPGSADTDALSVFFLMAAMALWLHATRARLWAPAAPSGRPPGAEEGGRGGRPVLAIAGIAAGLGVSVKLTVLAPVLALSVAVIAVGPSGRRRAVAGVWLAAVAAGGGFWYVRNLMAIGNPFPWFGHGVLPTPQPPLMQKTEFTVLHYLTNTDVWTRVFVPALRNNLGPWWVAIVTTVLAGALLGVAFGPGRTVRMIGLVTLGAIVGYLVTPGTAAGTAGHPSGFAFNLRYAAPALTLGLTAAPLARPLAGTRMRWVTLLVLALILGFTFPDVQSWGEGVVAASAIAAAILLLAGLGLGAIRTLGSIQPWRRMIPLAVGLAVLGAVGAGGYAAQSNYLRRRYISVPNAKTLTMLWNWVRGVHHARVGIGGTAVASYQYPLWGADDSNRVEYVAQRGPDGSFTPISTCRKWRKALNAGHYQYVVTSVAVDAVTRAPTYSPEGDWTLGDTGARLLTGSPRHSRYLVFQIVRPLDPAGCRRVQKRVAFAVIAAAH